MRRDRTRRRGKYAAPPPFKKGGKGRYPLAREARGDRLVLYPFIQISCFFAGSLLTLSAICVNIYKIFCIIMLSAGY